MCIFQTGLNHALFLQASKNPQIVSAYLYQTLMRWRLTDFSQFFCLPFCSVNACFLAFYFLHCIPALLCNEFERTEGGYECWI